MDGGTGIFKWFENSKQEAVTLLHSYKHTQSRIVYLETWTNKLNFPRPISLYPIISNQLDLFLVWKKAIFELVSKFFGKRDEFSQLKSSHL